MIGFAADPIEDRDGLEQCRSCGRHEREPDSVYCEHCGCQSCDGARKKEPEADYCQDNDSQESRMMAADDAKRRAK